VKNGKTSKGNFFKLRKQAEKKLETRLENAEDLSHLPSETKDRLLHELQVYQIELEMQNEELLRSQLELEAARKNYADLYNFAPVGYITISEQGHGKIELDRTRGTAFCIRLKRKMYKARM